MTEAEAIENALLAAANGITSFTVYISVTFGYLAAAYFVGRNLTRAQVAIFNSLFVFASFSCLLSLDANLVTQAVAISQAPELYPDRITNQAGFWRIYMDALLAAGILASLYFMFAARRSGETP